MMITSDKFNATIDSYQSRLYSPVFQIQSNENLKYCLRFKFNVQTKLNDGFNVNIENYQNPDEFKILFTFLGALKFDRWYSANIEIQNTEFTQNRVIFSLSKVNSV
jgi:hypothetical protein